MNTPATVSRLTEQRGAALLLAMLVVALVASLSATAYWQQWQQFEIERSARQRSQAQWLLTGALDWARLILREDARGSRTDHLAEPWAIPVQETTLSSFLTAGSVDSAATTLKAKLAGHISDEQGKLNWRNLIDSSSQPAKLMDSEWQAFSRLFAMLQLPAAELDRLSQNLLEAYTTSDRQTLVFLPPQRYEQLAALGLSQTTLERLAPYTTWLPENTPLNLNTAPATVLAVTWPHWGMGAAQSAVAEREREPFVDLEQFKTRYPDVASGVDNRRHGVSSRYFLVHGRLQIDNATLAQQALVVRNGGQVRVVWRDYSGLQAMRSASPGP